MLSDYLPRGPDESASIRRLAEEQWEKVSRSKSVREKSSFLEFAQTITDDLIGINKKKRSAERQDKHKAYAKSVLASDPHFRVPEVIRHASMESLTSAQGLRERMTSALLATGDFISSPTEEQKQVEQGTSWERSLEDAHASFAAPHDSYRVHAKATGSVSTRPASGNRGITVLAANRKFFGVNDSVNYHENVGQSSAADAFGNEPNTFEKGRMRDHLEQMVKEQPYRLLNESLGNIDSMERSILTKSIQNDAMDITRKGTEPKPYSKYDEESGNGRLPTSTKDIEAAVRGKSSLPTDTKYRTFHNDFLADDDVPGIEGDITNCSLLKYRTENDIDTLHQQYDRRFAPTYGGTHSTAPKKPSIDRFSAAMATCTVPPVHPRASNSPMKSQLLDSESGNDQVRLSSNFSQSMARYHHVEDDAASGKAKDHQEIDFPSLEQNNTMRKAGMQKGNVEYSTIDSNTMHRYEMAAASGVEESSVNSRIRNNVLSFSIDGKQATTQHMNKAEGNVKVNSAETRKMSATIPAASSGGKGSSMLGSLLCGNIVNALNLPPTDDNSRIEITNDNQNEDIDLSEESDSYDEEDECDEEVHIDLSSFEGARDQTNDLSPSVYNSTHTDNKHSHNVYNINNHYAPAPEITKEAEGAAGRDIREDSSLRRGMASTNLHIHNQMPVAINPISGTSMLTDPTGKLGVIYPNHDPFLLAPQRYTHITAADAASSAARRRAIQEAAKYSFPIGITNVDPSLVYVPVASVNNNNTSAEENPTGYAKDLESTRDGYTLRNSVDLSGLSLQRLRELTGSY